MSIGRNPAVRSYRERLNQRHSSAGKERRSGDHLLLTVLGTNPKPVRYALGDRRIEARLAPVALMNLLPPGERPEQVLALCTAEAKSDSWPLLEQALGAECSMEAVEVPAGDAQEDVDSYLSRVTQAIAGDLDLTVDVTHGYRHFSFLTYVAVLYLAALRGVGIRGAYYGLLRSGAQPVLPARGGDPAPNVTDAVDSFRDGTRGMLLERIMGEGGLQWDGGAFRLDTAPERLPEAVFVFGQALTRIHDLLSPGCRTAAARQVPGKSDHDASVAASAPSRKK